MKALAFAVVLSVGLLTLTAGGVRALSATTSATVSPGPFGIALEREVGFIIFNVIDATGSGDAWWSTASYSCFAVPVGLPVDTNIQMPDPLAGPHPEGLTLIAETNQRMGHFQLAFEDAPGEWSSTYAHRARDRPDRTLIRGFSIWRLTAV